MKPAKSPAEVFAESFARQLAAKQKSPPSRTQGILVGAAILGAIGVVAFSSFDKAAERARIDAVVASEFVAETHDQKVARLAAKARAAASASAARASETYAMDDLISDIDGLYTSGKIGHADMLALKSTAIAGAALATAKAGN